MSTKRLEAYSDAVIAIIITIMVLELRPPQGASWSDLGAIIPTLLAYILSFVYLSIYWNNHHHLLHVSERVNGAILWSNIHLLFWLSLVPFTTSWLSGFPGTKVPSAVYGLNLFLAGFAYFLLTRTLRASHASDSLIGILTSYSFKEKISTVLYILGIAVSLLDLVFLAYTIFALVALIWVIPDKRYETIDSMETLQRNDS